MALVHVGIRCLSSVNQRFNPLSNDSGHQLSVFDQNFAAKHDVLYGF